MKEKLSILSIYRFLSIHDLVTVLFGMFGNLVMGATRNVAVYFTSLTIGYLASGDSNEKIRQDMLFVLFFLDTPLTRAGSSSTDISSSHS